MRTSIATVSSADPSPRSSRPPPGPVSTASRSSRTTCSPAPSPRGDPGPLRRSRPHHRPLPADAGHRGRARRAVRPQPAPRPAQVRGDGQARRGHRPGLLQRLPARRGRRRPRRRAAEPTGRPGPGLRHPGRLRGARLGTARQHVRPRLAHRRDRRPPALGTCLDSFHILSRSSDPKDLEGIADIPGEKIFFLQLADAPLLGMDVLQWSRHHRCFPGQGGFDVAGLVKHVLRTGYGGPLSLEVFNDVFRQAEAARPPWTAAAPC